MRGYIGSAGLPSTPWQAAQTAAFCAPACGSPQVVSASASTAEASVSGAVSTGSASGSGVTVVWAKAAAATARARSEEHTSELQSLMCISYAVFCLKKKTPTCNNKQSIVHTNEVNR